MTTLLDLIARLHQLKAEAQALEDDEELPHGEKHKLRKNNECEMMNTILAIGGISLVDLHSVAISLVDLHSVAISLVDLHSVAGSLKDIAESLRAIAKPSSAGSRS